MTMQCDRSCFDNGFWTAIIFILGGLVFLTLYVSWQSSNGDTFTVIKEVASIIASISTLVIAVYAYLQYKIYRFSLNNELFNRRSKVYESIKELFEKILNSDEFDLDDRSKYLEGVKGYNFLFRKDIQEYVKSVLKQAVLFRKYDKKNMGKEKEEIYDWFTSESDKIDNRFMKYLKIYE